MTHITVKRGLDIPVEGQPQGERLSPLHKPQAIALNLSPFEQVRFKLLVAVGDKVSIGQPLAYDKSCPRRMFVSPAGGTISELRRGEKRRLLNIVIDVDDDEVNWERAPLDIKVATREEIVEHLLAGGLFAHIRKRPFDVLADPDAAPRSIFVKAVETAPLSTPTSLALLGNEEDFQHGLSTLGRLTSGDVHLVYSDKTTVDCLLDAKDVVHHTVSGPHPSSNSSVHIHHIDPIESAQDIVWTVRAVDVIAIGAMMRKGLYFTDRVISIAGPGVEPEKRGFFKGRLGFPIGDLVAGRNKGGLLRLLSGCVLTGEKVDLEDFLHFYHTLFTVLPETGERDLFHFLRPAGKHFSASRTTHSGLFPKPKKKYPFSTRQHGEHRYMVDGTIYEKVMPMRIPVMPLIRAIQAGDDDLCEQLGILEVAPEDFSLPAFICPCKTEMPSLVKEALTRLAQEMV